jgi:hypothetical protein
MARSQLSTISTDATSDTGGVLWSVVQGEQLEFPISLNFLTNAYGYTFEAVVMEALNVSGVDALPTQARTNGINTTLVTRVPVEMGVYSAGTTYAREEVVEHPASSGLYFKSKVGSNLANTPATNTAYWASYVPNQVFIQFPESLSQVVAASPISTTAASSAGGVATITLGSNMPQIPAVGTTVTISGVSPVGFNGTYTITAATINSVSFANATAGPQTVAGTCVVNAGWVVQPTFVSSVYGYFELRVTEPAGGIFQRTWKPMRGIVEVLYSPTKLV